MSIYDRLRYGRGDRIPLADRFKDILSPDFNLDDHLGEFEWPMGPAPRKPEPSFEQKLEDIETDDEQVEREASPVPDELRWLLED